MLGIKPIRDCSVVPFKNPSNHDISTYPKTSCWRYGDWRRAYFFTNRSRFILSRCSAHRRHTLHCDFWISDLHSNLRISRFDFQIHPWDVRLKWYVGHVILRAGALWFKLIAPKILMGLEVGRWVWMPFRPPWSIEVEPWVQGRNIKPILEESCRCYFPSVSHLHPHLRLSIS
jgi:hypothetical protein